MSHHAGGHPAGKRSLHAWAEALSREEMPIFGQTLQEVVSVTGDERAPASALARVILQDASMTARTLKLVNTAFYNPRETAISTISRAVVLLGFDTVRNLCLSLALVDSFVKGKARERLQHELARAIHAAVQARALAVSLALSRYDDSPEEVFIAALLYRVGEMAFWCFGGEACDELDRLMREPGYTPEQAQREVLGFPLSELTDHLAKEWRVNELLTETLAHPHQAGLRGQLVMKCHHLAEVAEQGWESDEMEAVTREIAEVVNRSPLEVRGLLHHEAHEAAQIAGLYGASAAAKVIPLPGTAPAITAEVPKPEPFPEPDGLLQLRILRELSAVLEGKADFNLVMELVLEGMYRGIGLDRTLFALLTPDRRGLRAKFALGDPHGQLTRRFQMRLDPDDPDVFINAVERQTPAWVDRERVDQPEQKVTSGTTAIVGKRPFFVAPIVISGKPVGIFYGDRALSGRALDEESYQSFLHFAQQANLGLTHIAKRRR